MGVTPLGVGRRGAAFTVFLRRQVLAAWGGGRGRGLGVVVEVAGIAFAPHGHHPTAGCVVAVTNVGAARGCGRCKMPVAVRPVTGQKR